MCAMALGESMAESVRQDLQSSRWSTLQTDGGARHYLGHYPAILFVVIHSVPAGTFSADPVLTAAIPFHYNRELTCWSPAAL